MNLRCPRCGAPVEPEDTFCGECGKGRGEESTQG